MDRESDEKLIAACCEGDQRASAALVERHYKRVFLICLGMVGRVADAEDLAQDALLRGFVKVRKLRRRGGSWGAWFMRALCRFFLG